MKRLPDWQVRLEAFAKERAAMPFAWGSNDCCLFAAAGVEAQTGVVLMPDARGYSTAREALRILEAHGGLRAFATLALGPEIPPKLAAVGDVVMVRMGEAEALGICNGGVVIGPGLQGMEVAGMNAALAAWRV